MAISHFGNSEEDFVNLAGFPDFGGFPSAVGKGLGNLVAQQPSPPTTSDGSPDSSAPAARALGDEDDDDADSGSEDLHKKSHDSGIPQANKRGKASSAERRATHNAIERARRESLNGRFLELANALPTMANVKRPSKSVIVNKSLEWIYESQIREHALVRENNALRAELNDMRARLQMPPLSTQAALPLSSDVARYKAAGVAVPDVGGQFGGPLSPVHGTQVPNYFGPSAALPALGTSHTSAQHPAHSSAPLGHVAATMPRGHHVNFSNPFETQHLANGFLGTAGHLQPSSPTSRSDSGSENGALGTSAQSKSKHGVPPIGGSGLGSAGDRAVAGPAVSQAETMAALQAAHFQQQQFAAFAAATANTQPQLQAGRLTPTAAAWPLGSGFLF